MYILNKGPRFAYFLPINLTKMTFLTNTSIQVGQMKDHPNQNGQYFLVKWDM